jgi:hypothetical protein
VFASSHRFSLYDGFFADFASALGFSDPATFAYVLLATWFVIGAAIVYLVAYRPRIRSPRSLEWAVSVACDR